MYKTYLGSKFYIAVILGLALGSTACGRKLPDKPYVDPLGGSPSATSSLTSGAADWRCPEAGTYNVVPSSGNVAGEGSYAVCRSASDPSKFKISGFTRSQVVCVYPMNSRPGSASTQMADRRYCYQMGNGPIITQFSSSQVNYLYIVDSQFTNAMEACLSSSHECPPYSEGSLY